MVWKAKTNLKGPEGIQGPIGPQGLPGMNAIPTDAAVAGYIGTEGESATKTALDAAFVRKGALFTNIMDHGAKGDGIANDKPALLAALQVGAALNAPLTVYFPPGVYNCAALGEVLIDRPGVSLVGASRESVTILLTTGLRPVKGKFGAQGISFKAPTRSSDYRAIMVPDTYVTGMSRSVSGYRVKDCNFEGFFYSTHFMGGVYSTDTDPTYVAEYFVRDIEISGCTSVAPPTGNAGHFQFIQTADVSVIGCSTYGGAGATSYNFIQSNGYLRVVGNYCDGNTYGSCEIENQSGDATVSGNTFKSKVWIDDSQNVSVTGNLIEEQLSITIQTYDVKNIQVTGNILDRASVMSFGNAEKTNSAARLDGVSFVGNTFKGAGVYGLFIQDLLGARMRGIDISSNFFTGTYSSGAIGIVRNASIHVRALWNHCRASSNNITISGTGGTINTMGNSGATTVGTTERITLSNSDFRVTGGVVVISPGGNTYRIGVSDTGAISATLV